MQVCRCWNGFLSELPFFHYFRASFGGKFRKSMIFVPVLLHNFFFFPTFVPAPKKFLMETFVNNFRHFFFPQWWKLFRKTMDFFFQRVKRSLQPSRIWTHNRWRNVQDLLKKKQPSQTNSTVLYKACEPLLYVHILKNLTIKNGYYKVVKTSSVLTPSKSSKNSLVFLVVC